MAFLTLFPSFPNERLKDYNFFFLHFRPLGLLGLLALWNLSQLLLVILLTYFGEFGPFGIFCPPAFILSFYGVIAPGIKIITNSKMRSFAKYLILNVFLNEKMLHNNTLLVRCVKNKLFNLVKHYSKVSLFFI